MVCLQLLACQEERSFQHFFSHGFGKILSQSHMPLSVVKGLNLFGIRLAGIHLDYGHYGWLDFKNVLLSLTDKELVQCHERFLIIAWTIWIERSH